MAATLNGLWPLQTPMYPGLDLNDNQTPRVIGTCVTLLVVSTVAVALRFLARRLSRAGLWWDDWTILVALILSYGANICVLVSLKFGFGRHMGAMGTLLQRIDAASSWLKLFYAYETVYCICISVAKYSILLFYSRIFKERRFRIALYVAYALVTCNFITFEVTILAQCQPASALWDFTQAGHCIDMRAFFIGSGVLNVIINVIILVLPLPMIWTLEIERKHKLALSGVFLLGGFVVVVSIVRTIVLAQIQYVDITWTFVDGAIWTAIEPTVAVCSACLPILRSLWIWNREKSEAQRSKPETCSVVQANQERHRSAALRAATRGAALGRFPLNELPASELERGASPYKAEVMSNFSTSTTNADYPTYAHRVQMKHSATRPYYIETRRISVRSSPAESSTAGDRSSSSTTTLTSPGGRSIPDVSQYGRSRSHALYNGRDIERRPTIDRGRGLVEHDIASVVHETNEDESSPEPTIAATNPHSPSRIDATAPSAHHEIAGEPREHGNESRSSERSNDSTAAALGASLPIQSSDDLARDAMGAPVDLSGFFFVGKDDDEPAELSATFHP